MTVRTDLLELTADALVALSNTGFVKRAQKDAAEGKLPEIEEDDDGTVLARYTDGAVTALGPGRPLREARCSCPASGLCRHRVTLVLAYQARHAARAPSEEAWCPSQLAAQVELLPRATLEQARRLAAAHPAIRLSTAHPPAARLPMCDVRFLSRTSLAMARCDCQQAGNCAHVAIAVWAFVQGQRQQPGFAALTVELDRAGSDEPAQSEVKVDAEAEPACASIAALALRLWMDGTAQTPMALDTPFERALADASRAGWCWVVEALSHLRNSVAAQHARASHADPASLLRQVSQLMARLGAARAAGAASTVPRRQVLGVGVEGEIVLDHLRLVPLGSQCWSDDAAEGVRLIWADPDTLAVTVMEKSWPRTLADAPSAALRERRLLGLSLHRLGASQIVTRAARRRANGKLTVGNAARQTSVLPLSALAWQHLGQPLRQPDVRSLRAHLASLPPDFVRPLQAVEHVHVLPAGQLRSCAWNAAGQVLEASVCIDEEDELLHLRLRYDLAAPAAIDALASALLGAPLALAGTIRLEAGQVVMTPLAVMMANGLVVPQLAAAGPAPALPAAMPAHQTDLQKVLQATLDLLGQWLRQGLRHLGQPASIRAGEQAAALRAAGLSHCAEALVAAVETAQSTDARALPSRMAGLHALLEMMGNEAI